MLEDTTNESALQFIRLIRTSHSLGEQDFRGLAASVITKTLPETPFVLWRQLQDSRQSDAASDPNDAASEHVKIHTDITPWLSFYSLFQLRTAVQKALHFKDLLASVNGRYIELASRLRVLVRRGTSHRFTISHISLECENGLSQFRSCVESPVRFAHYREIHHLRRAMEVLGKLPGPHPDSYGSSTACSCGAACDGEVGSADRHAPHRWLMEQKMERAKQLLESTSLTIKPGKHMLMANILENAESDLTTTTFFFGNNIPAIDQNMELGQTQENPLLSLL